MNELPAKDSLPPQLAELEAALSLVQQALTQRDPALLELHAGQVQGLLAQALASARAPGAKLPAPLRERLAMAGAQLAAQRQALGRATASLDRALEVLMPSEPLGLYAQSGRPLRQRSSGDSLSA
jgi:hypothetical protein